MDIYWGIQPANETLSDLDFIWQEPITLFDHIKNNFKESYSKDNYLMCPSILKEVKKTFIIKSPITFNLLWYEDQLKSYNMTQQFFDDMVLIRDFKTGFFSINMHMLFFAEKNVSLTILPAYFEDNSFTRNSKILSGSFDISSWFRPLDLAFFMNRKNELMEINRDDILFYVKFETNEEINLKRFHTSEKIFNIARSCVNTKNYIKYKKLSFLYSLFRTSGYNKRLIKEIKNNIY